MAEHITCGLIGLTAGGVSGYMAHAGMKLAEPVGSILLVGLLFGIVLGIIAFLFVGLSRTEQLLGAFALLGLILGGLAGLIGSAGVIVLAGTLPWYIVAAILGFAVGFFLCWLCDRANILPTTSN